MAEIPFPGGAADQDVFFHEDKVCVYHKAINTWECRTIEVGTAVGQPAAVTTRTVYTIPIPLDGDEKVLPSPLDLPDLRTQYDVNWFLTDQIVRKARPPIISASPPTNHPQYPTAELEEGDLWIDPNHIMYYWNGNEWVEVKDSLYYQQDRFDDRYVNIDGDTMTGELELNNARRLYLNNTKVETRIRKESLKDGNGDPVLDAGGKEQWDDNEERFVLIESLPPHLLKSDGSFSADTSEPFGIEIEVDDGNTYKNQVKISNRNGDIITVASGTGPEVKLGKDFPGNKNPQNGDPLWEVGEEGGIKVTGIPTPTKENPDSSLAVNKGYVDTQTEFLQNEIIELEEELEALAPALERGKWLFNPLGQAGIGQYGLFALGTSTNQYPQADHVFINSVDSEGKTHGFSNVKTGTYLEIFSPNDGDVGIYQVVSNNGETLGANSYWDFEIEHIQSNRPTADAEGLCRFKFFELADGADATSFVLKAGDDMTGRLSMDQVADLEDFTVPQLKTKPSVRFLATKSDDSNSTHSLLYQPGYKMGLACSSAFWASTLITKSYLYGYEDKTESDGRITRDFKNAGIGFLRPDDNNTNNDYGSLAWKSTKPRLTWDANRVEIPKPVADNINADGFIIKGAISSDGYSGIDTNVQHDETLLKVYHNNNQSDAINYYGRVVNAKNIATKEYVDEKVGSGRVIITPLEFFMDSYTGYPGEYSIAGLTSGGNPTTSRDVYGYHIPFKWFERYHPELIGFVFNPEGNLINNKEAQCSIRELSGNPGIEIKDSSRQTSYATVTIQGFHVVVDDISEDQYTHKF